MAYYKLKTAVGALRVVKNWQTYLADYLGLIKKERVVYELRNGVRYEVRVKTVDRAALNEIWIHGHYTPEGFEINPADVVVDVGAHVGMFSVYASRLAGKGRVYAFEPMPQNFEMLERNLALNGVRNVSAINKAVSDETGSTHFFLSGHNTGGHSLYAGDDRTQGIKVETVSLKDFTGENKIKKIDFLKMDCEGGEYRILFGCPDKTLKLIRRISMEFHDIDEKQNVEALKKFLEEKGFKVRTRTDEITRMLYASRVSR